MTVKDQETKGALKRFLSNYKILIFWIAMQLVLRFQNLVSKGARLPSGFMTAEGKRERES